MHLARKRCIFFFWLKKKKENQTGDVARWHSASLVSQRVWVWSAALNKNTKKKKIHLTQGMVICWRHCCRHPNVFLKLLNNTKHLISLSFGSLALLLVRKYNLTGAVLNRKSMYEFVYDNTWRRNVSQFYRDSEGTSVRIGLTAPQHLWLHPCRSSSAVFSP